MDDPTSLSPHVAFDDRSPLATPISVVLVDARSQATRSRG